MKNIKLLAVVLLAAFFFTGCLTAEYKIYKFEFTGKNQGKLTIKYVNIMSKYDDDDITKEEQIQKDFDELINSYVKGRSVEDNYPNARFVEKRMYEENGKLCAEVVFEFTNIDQVKLFQYDKKSPFMMYLNDINESYYKSNGKQGPDYMPVIFWERKSKVLDLTTAITEPDESCTSLLAMWKDYEQNN